MDLTKANLPDYVIVSGRTFRIQTGHSFWFRFSQIIGQDKKYYSDFDFLYISDIPEDRKAGLDELLKFYYEKHELPRSDGDSGDRVLDYEIDSDLLYSALYKCYGVDLYEKQIHWHKVRALIAGLHDTKLNDVMGYRCSEPGKNKELARMKRIWSLPEKITPEDKEALDKFNAQFE